MTLYPISEIFASIQGEGANAGRAAWFVRLAGCSVGCKWCDSPEAQTTAGAEWLTAEEIRCKVSGAWCQMPVVITGGEPTQYDLTELTDALHKAGREVWLETSGVEPIRGMFDWICLSPKRHRPPLAENWALTNEIKVIIGSDGDFEFASGISGQVSGIRPLFLQPEWNRRESAIPLITEYIKANPQWRLSLQTHKYIGVR